MVETLREPPQVEIFLPGEPMPYGDNVCRSSWPSHLVDREMRLEVLRILDREPQRAGPLNTHRRHWLVRLVEWLTNPAPRVARPTPRHPASGFSDPGRYRIFHQKS